ncbi:MAG: YqaE/Pmp3 family membrane protein [Ferruginibacter sp.]
MKKILLLFVGVLLLSGTTLMSTAASVVPIHEVPTSTTNTKNVFNEAVKEFKSLSKAEKKTRIKEAKQKLKEIKAQKRAGERVTNTTLLVILAILIPPLAVYLHQGEINSKFWIALLLTLLFYLPGMIYALVVVLGKD